LARFRIRDKVTGGGTHVFHKSQFLLKHDTGRAKGSLKAKTISIYPLFYFSAIPSFDEYMDEYWATAYTTTVLCIHIKHSSCR